MENIIRSGFYTTQNRVFVVSQGHAHDQSPTVAFLSEALAAF